jgi:hypothetical protein
MPLISRYGPADARVAADFEPRANLATRFRNYYKFGNVKANPRSARDVLRCLAVFGHWRFLAAKGAQPLPHEPENDALDRRSLRTP